jgi:hypothetical protein
MRAIDQWITANLVTLAATLVSTTVCLCWLPANVRAGRTLTDRPARWLAWVNVTIIGVTVLVNGLVFGLGAWEVEQARAIDRAASPAHPARVPHYVTQGALGFMAIWLIACLAIISLSSVLSYIIAMPSGAGANENRPHGRDIREPRTRKLLTQT